MEACNVRVNWMSIVASAILKQSSMPSNARGVKSLILKTKGKKKQKKRSESR